MNDTELPWSTGAWRDELAQCVSSVDDLLKRVELTREDVGLGPNALKAERSFRLRVPRGLVSCIRKGFPRDPILLQVLPTDFEIIKKSGFVFDPLGETDGLGDGGTVKKYQGRALIVSTGACAIHCRYCFRRHFPYEQTGDSRRALAFIAGDSTITEVILSGGDPLMMLNDKLELILAAVEEIPHVKRIRIHTRLPVVLPQRVDHGLIEVLSRRRLPIVVVLHANHAQELSENVKISCHALAAADVTLLNQTVLLAGINDGVESLVALSEGLFDCRTLPYYLHLLDPVAGAAHFDVPEDRAGPLMAEVSARLPGYLVPRLVREVEGAPAKVMLSF